MQHKFSRPKIKQAGLALPTVVVFLTVIVVIATAITELAFSGYLRAAADRRSLSAQFAADAGVDYAVHQITLDSTWSGTTSDMEIHNGDGVKTEVEIDVLDVDGEKIITSIGKTYAPASAASPKSQRTVEVTLRPVDSGSGTFSVVTGVGGLYMSNSAKILGGDVFVNGEIEMSNTAQIGLSSDTTPLELEAAHQNCPVSGGAEYPRVCLDGENGEPISLTNEAHIYADVSANNQTNGDGMSNTGLQTPHKLVTDPDSPPISPLALPTHDRATQQANVTTTTSDDYYLTCDANHVTRTWTGRLKIEGDVTIKKSCEIILEGDVWITGSLTLQNSAQIKISDTITLGGQNTVDPDLPTIMVDGASGVLMQNTSAITSNSADVGAQVITYWSRAACSPDCADVTGTDLYNSRNDRTIYLQNSAEAPNSLLYSRWTQAELDNGGQIGAIVGQTVKLSNSAAITFGASTEPGGGGTPQYWVIESYRRVF